MSQKYVFGGPRYAGRNQPASTWHNKRVDTSQIYADHGLNINVKNDNDVAKKIKEVENDSRWHLEGQLHDKNVYPRAGQVTVLLHPDQYLRWQLGLSLAGGFLLLVLYSHYYKRPLFQ